MFLLSKRNQGAKGGKITNFETALFAECIF